MATRSEAYGDYKDDYLYHDGVEDVTIKRNGSSLATGVKAKQESPQKSPLTSFGGDVQETVDNAAWVVWASTLGGQVLHEADVILRASGEAWRITACGLQLWDTQWHAQSIKNC